MSLNRWALYPPGRVPLGVTVHVNEDDGDVNIETPSSLEVFKTYFISLLIAFTQFTFIESLFMCKVVARLLPSSC